MDTSQITISLTKKKLEKIIKKCQEMLIHLPSCTVQSVIPARIQYRYPQELQVSDVKLQNILSDTGPLEQFGKNRTSLVVENLKISNGKNKTSGHPFSDTKRYNDQRLGSTLQWYLNGEGKEFHINILDLIEDLLYISK